MKNKDVEEVVARWDSLSGKEFKEAVLNPSLSQIQYKKACKNFFGIEDSLVRSEAFGRVGDFEDLRGLDISLKNLANLVFAVADLSFANLEGSTLDGTSFSCAKLCKTSLKSVIAKSGVDFFQCYAIEAVFDGARINNANFSNADLKFSSFKNTTFENCDFSGAQFQHANMDGVVMIDCNVERTSFSKNQEFEPWYISGKFLSRNGIIWE